MSDSRSPDPVPLREWLLAVQLLPAGVVLGLWVRRGSVERAAELLGRWAHVGAVRRLPVFDGDLSPAQLYRAASRATRFACGGRRCLPRSLLLLWLLARRGHRPVLCIGVARGGATVQGHAWVELDGRPVGESQGMLDLFSTLYRRSAA